MNSLRNKFYVQIDILLSGEQKPALSYWISTYT